MKQLSLLLVTTISLTFFNAYSAYATNAIFDSDTNIVNIPIVEIHGSPVFSNVELQMRSDGLFELINFTAISNTTNSNTISFPYQDNIEFHSEYRGSVFVASNGSMWQITGLTAASYLGSGNKDYTIYSGTSGMVNPLVGEISDYFMIVSGSSITCFVRPVNAVEEFSDNIEFHSEYLGSIFIASNGSMWQITGLTAASYLGSGNKDYTIYSGTSGMVNPLVGEMSDHFMLVSGSSITYFVAPL